MVKGELRRHVAEIRKHLGVKAIRTGAGRERTRAALREAIRELEAWEAQAGSEREWLLRLMSEKAAAELLGHPCDVSLYSTLKTPQGRAWLEVYKSIPCSDTLLLLQRRSAGGN